MLKPIFPASGKATGSTESAPTGSTPTTTTASSINAPGTTAPTGAWSRSRDTADSSSRGSWCGTTSSSRVETGIVARARPPPLGRLRPRSRLGLPRCHDMRRSIRARTFFRAPLESTSARGFGHAIGGRKSDCTRLMLSTAVRRDENKLHCKPFLCLSFKYLMDKFVNF